MDVIGALLDNSTLFIEPSADYLTDRLPLLRRPLLITPTPTTCFVYSIAFTTDPRHLHTSDGANDATFPDTTFHNTSFFGSPHCEDPASGASFD